MEIKLSSASAALQRNATGSGPLATQDGHPLTSQELQKLGDQIRATAQAQAAAATGQAAVPAPPAPPAPPRTITIRGADGSQTTVVGVPGNFGPGDVMPPEVKDISIAFFVTVAIIIIGFPIARAIARSLDRRGRPAQVPSELNAQLTQLAQAVDAIALEVERISEGQRFTTRLLSEQRDSASQTLPSQTNR
ncbi:MAG: hypothetical protein M3Z18_05070 [Gemmatimonadota bacterium]|nr:hypothetical protein [Gemmatimonadota bacterium]